jgi:hypothetical protein
VATLFYRPSQCEMSIIKHEYGEPNILGRINWEGERERLVLVLHCSNHLSNDVAPLEIYLSL